VALAMIAAQFEPRPVPYRYQLSRSP